MTSASPPSRMPYFPLEHLDQEFALHALEFIWAAQGRIYDHRITQTNQIGTAVCFAEAYLETSNLNMEKIYTFQQGTLHIQPLTNKINRVWLSVSEGTPERTLGPYDIHTWPH